MEKDCHNGARQQAKSIIELLGQRTVNEQRVELERTLFEIASDRARTGAPLEEEADKRQGRSWSNESFDCRVLVTLYMLLLFR